MARRKKWDPKRMKAVIKAMRNKEMGRCKASRIFNVPQTTLDMLKTGRNPKVKL
jgi:hypothetical protein